MSDGTASTLAHAIRWIKRFADARRAIDMNKDMDDLVHIDVSLTTSESKDLVRVQKMLEILVPPTTSETVGNPEAARLFGAPSCQEEYQ